MSVLVTGGSGFIGQHVLDHLRDAGADIHAISSRRQPADDGVTWHRADFLRDDLSPLLQRIKPRRVIHLAWECGNYGDPIHLDWLRASLRWLDALRLNGCTHLTTAGSSMEYRWTQAACDEIDGPFDPPTIYGEAKYALGRLTAAYCKHHGLGHAHARVFFVCGVGQPGGKLLTGAIENLLEGKPFACRSGDAWRDYLDAADVGQYLARLSLEDAAGPFNIAAGKPVQLRQIMDAIGAELGRPELLKIGTDGPDAPRDVALASVDRLRDTLGVTPKFDARVTIGRMIEWMRTPQATRSQ